jgi:hypothetical protein
VRPTFWFQCNERQHPSRIRDGPRHEPPSDSVLCSEDGGVSRSQLNRPGHNQNKNRTFISSNRDVTQSGTTSFAFTSQEIHRLMVNTAHQHMFAIKELSTQFWLDRH